eukprot:scaffold39787_cov40-Attheya_sp.AAC.1
MDPPDSHGPPSVYSDVEGATHQRITIGSLLDSRGSPVDSHGSPIVYSNAAGATHQRFPIGSTIDSHGCPIVYSNAEGATQQRFPNGSTLASCGFPIDSHRVSPIVYSNEEGTTHQCFPNELSLDSYKAKKQQQIVPHRLGHQNRREASMFHHRPLKLTDSSSTLFCSVKSESAYGDGYYISHEGVNGLFFPHNLRYPTEHLSNGPSTSDFVVSTPVGGHDESLPTSVHIQESSNSNQKDQQGFPIKEYSPHVLTSDNNELISSILSLPQYEFLLADKIDNIAFIFEEPHDSSIDKPLSYIWVPFEEEGMSVKFYNPTSDYSNDFIVVGNTPEATTMIPQIIKWNQVKTMISDEDEASVTSASSAESSSKKRKRQCLNNYADFVSPFQGLTGTNSPNVADLFCGLTSLIKTIMAPWLQPSESIFRDDDAPSRQPDFQEEIAPGNIVEAIRVAKTNVSQRCVPHEDTQNSSKPTMSAVVSVSMIDENKDRIVVVAYGRQSLDTVIEESN